MKIGFIGTGVMGTGMIQNLLRAHFAVTVFNRTKAHADAVLKLGTTWADSPAQVAAASDVVISMVGFPQDVEQIYFGQAGIFEGAKPATTVIDMTTSTPALAERIAARAQELGLSALDAPVSGGDVGAQNGTLSIMVGGEAATLARVRPVLEAMGQSIHHFGGPGRGQHAKMANQIMIAGTMTGLAEMLAYAKAAGLDPQTVLDTVGQGSGANWSLSHYGPRILAGDLKPGFYIKHFIKDLGIALDAAAEMHLDLPATRQAKALYDTLAKIGDGDLGTQALIRYYQ